MNREGIADPILLDIEDGGGVFPDSNTFIERVRPKHRDRKAMILSIVPCAL